MTGRILCLGDSLTYGFGLPRGLVWTALCAAQTGAELLGGGVNGNTTGGMLAVLPDLLPVLDFDRAFTRWGEEGLFQPDGLHPNAAGHCLMAETAAALIRSL